MIAVRSMRGDNNLHSIMYLLILESEAHEPVEKDIYIP